MSKNAAFKDVLKCLDYLGYKGLTEEDLLCPSKDEIVNPVLYQLGINPARGWYIQANKMRTLDIESIIGYRYVGVVRNDHEWLNSKYSDVMDRIAASSFEDISLTQELCELLGKSVDIMSDYSALDEQTDYLLIVDSYAEDKKLIDSMNKKIIEKRGVV